MNSIFRVRPLNYYAIDELKELYLWFSRPCAFRGDTQDANIGAFMTDTEAIKKGFDSFFEQERVKKWLDALSYTGICCFTKEFPAVKNLSVFPKCSGGNAICVEYNKAEIEKCFVSSTGHPMGKCFHKVVYAKYPTKIQQDGEWSFLWKKTKDGEIYETIPGLLYSHPRKFDEFVIMLMTRLNMKFKKQKEERIILGGINIPPHNTKARGYKISIPPSSINRVWVYPMADEQLIDKLKGISDIKGKLCYVLSC